MTPTMRWMSLLMAVMFAAPLGFAQKGSIIPFDVSGSYQFLQEGEVLQINVQGEALSGYINAHGSGDSDRELILAFFIREANRDGKHLNFKTKVIHGVSYAFDGHIERGPGKAPTDEGYLLIVGRLTQTTTDDAYRPSNRQTEVTLRSAQEGLTGDWTRTSATQP